MIDSELNGLRGMMAVADPETREEYLEKWFISPVGKAIGNDPRRREKFAVGAGMTKEELDIWQGPKHPTTDVGESQ